MENAKSEKELLAVIRYRTSNEEYKFRCLYGPDYNTERDLVQDISTTCSNLHQRKCKIVWVRLFGDSEIFVK